VPSRLWHVVEFVFSNSSCISEKIRQVSAMEYEVRSYYRCVVSHWQSKFSMHRQAILLRNLSLPAVQLVMMVNQQKVAVSCLMLQQHLMPACHQRDVRHCHNDLLPAVAPASCHLHLYHLLHIMLPNHQRLLGYQIYETSITPSFGTLTHLIMWIIPVSQ